MPSWGLPPTLKGFWAGDDAQDPDIFVLSATGVGVLQDLVWQGSAAGPVTPTGYTAKMVNLMAVNRAVSGQELQIYTDSAASSLNLAAVVAVPGGSGGFQASTEQWRVIAPPTTKFQVASAQTSLGQMDVVALVRYVKAAGM
jgi:hypothetical protein